MKKRKVKKSKKRIVVKLGTNLLTKNNNQLDIKTIDILTNQISYLINNNEEILIVTSGAVTAGNQIFSSDNKVKKNNKKISFRQFLASVGQPELMTAYKNSFHKHNINVAQILLTREDLQVRKRYLNFRNTVENLLSSNIIPIINENDVVAVDELTGNNFGDNDTLSAMVANAIDANLLILLGEVDGFYSTDPFNDSEAKIISQVSEITPEIKSYAKDPHDEVGTGGMKSKIDAAKLSMDSGIIMIIASGYTTNILIRLVESEEIGTIFIPKVTRLEARKRWILSGKTKSTGKVIIDEGANIAIKTKGNSLLPAGIVDVKKIFKRGDIIEIISLNNNTVGWGISNYDSNEVSKIKGNNSENIEKILGHSYGEEVVHRNNMTVTEK